MKEGYAISSFEYAPDRPHRSVPPTASLPSGKGKGKAVDPLYHDVAPQSEYQLSSTHRTAWSGNIVLPPGQTARITNKPVPPPPSNLAAANGHPGRFPYRGPPAQYLEPATPVQRTIPRTYNFETGKSSIDCDRHPFSDSPAVGPQPTPSPSYALAAGSYPYHPTDAGGALVCNAPFRRVDESVLRKQAIGREKDAPNQPQCVMIDKIEDGQDVRTTLMIRNIPNRFNSQSFNELLETTSRGHFDFSYLRTDFGNNCNVGYAFVNFIRPELIVNFYHARVGKTWPGLKSDKILEVSYATIQGQDCLIQKFRNSSVMQEFPGFRPKLWYSEDDLDTPANKDIGDERPFLEEWQARGW